MTISGSAILLMAAMSWQGAEAKSGSEHNLDDSVVTMEGGVMDMPTEDPSSEEESIVDVEVVSEAEQRFRRHIEYLQATTDMTADFGALAITVTRGPHYRYIARAIVQWTLEGHIVPTTHIIWVNADGLSGAYSRTHD